MCRGLGLQQGAPRIFRQGNQCPCAANDAVLNVGNHGAETAFLVGAAVGLRLGRVEHISRACLWSYGFVPPEGAFLIAQILRSSSPAFALGFRHGVVAVDVHERRVHVQAIQVVSDDRTIDLNHVAQPHGFDSALVKNHGGIFDHFRRTDVHGRVLQGRADQLLVHHAVDRKGLLGGGAVDHRRRRQKGQHARGPSLQMFSHSRGLNFV